MGELSIDDLLRSLQNPETGTLDNTEDTWRRLGARSDFSELGLEKSDLEEFLKEWAAANPYSNI